MDCPKIPGLHTLKRVPLPPSSSPSYNPLVPPVSQTIRVTVLFFARLKEFAGHAEDSIELADAATIGQLFAIYTVRYPELAKYRPPVVASPSRDFSSADTPLSSATAVASL